MSPGPQCHSWDLNVGDLNVGDLNVVAPIELVRIQIPTVKGILIYGERT